MDFFLNEVRGGGREIMGVWEEGLYVRRCLKEGSGVVRFVVFVCL